MCRIAETRRWLSSTERRGERQRLLVRLAAQELDPGQLVQDTGGWARTGDEAPQELLAASQIAALAHEQRQLLPRFAIIGLAAEPRLEQRASVPEVPGGLHREHGHEEGHTRLRVQGEQPLCQGLRVSPAPLSAQHFAERQLG